MTDPVSKISNQFENMSAKQIAEVLAVGFDAIKYRVQKVDKHFFLHARARFNLFNKFHSFR